MTFTKDPYISAGFSALTQKSWRNFELMDLAAIMQQPLHIIKSLFPTKYAWMAHVHHHLDTVCFDALEGIETPRDRVIEFFLMRLEALGEEHKQAVAIILDGLKKDPVLIKQSGVRTFETMLRLCDHLSGTAFVFRQVKAGYLSTIWPMILCEWIQDKSKDQARTYKKIDDYLAQGERLMTITSAFGRPF